MKPEDTESLRKLVIYGLSNPLIFKLLDAINRRRPTFDPIGIVNSAGDPPGVNHYGHPRLGDDAEIPRLAERADLFFFCNINRSPREMKSADAWLDRHECRTVSLLHPDIDLSDVTLGRNVCLAEGCLVGPAVVLGDHVTGRMGAIISHEVIIEDWVYLGPGVKVCGGARLQAGADIGAGATILPRVTIGRNVIVGAGAVVIGDLPDNVTAVGVPARVIRTHAPGDPRFI